MYRKLIRVQEPRSAVYLRLRLTVICTYMPAFTPCSLSCKFGYGSVAGFELTKGARGKERDQAHAREGHPSRGVMRVGVSTGVDIWLSQGSRR